MKKVVKILIILAIFVFIMYFTVLFMNSFVIPPPSKPLRFIILNKDNTSHHITVEIINRSGSVIFSQKYEINPSEKIESPVITRVKGTYLLRVVLDDEIVKERFVSVASGYGQVSIVIHPQERYKYLKERISIDQSVI